MSEALAALDRLLKVLDEQAIVNEKMMEGVHLLNLLDDQRAGEIAELREGLAALSNRIEGLTRVVMSTDFPGHPRGRGDTITFAPDDSGKA